MNEYMEMFKEITEVLKKHGEVTSALRYNSVLSATAKVGGATVRFDVVKKPERSEEHELV